MRLILAAIMALLAAPAIACGPDTDCFVLDGTRTYRLYLPDGAQGPTGAVFHAHGYRGSAGGAMRNAALRAMSDRLGMAFVALNADADDWNLAHRPRAPHQIESAEFAYVAAVIEDLAQRIDLDRDRLIATGFSAGAMLTWTLACGMSDSFAGFVPYAGTFWAPVPATCPTPTATLIHIHGIEDTTVPLEGRAIGPTRQGSVTEALAMYARHGEIPALQPVPFPEGEGCRAATATDETMLALCLFQGGHSYGVARVEWAIEQILAGL